jgi:hypothetical protein
MSTTSASRATPSSSASSNNKTTLHGVKVATPNYYSSEHNKLKDWLLQFNLYFTFQGTNLPNNHQVSLAATFMQGDALK